MSGLSDTEDSYDSGSTLSSSSNDEPPPIPPFPQILANFWLGEKLGSGYSGSIFRATHIHNHQTVALKVQHTSHENLTNRYERNFYPLIQGGVGMPKLWGAGVEGCWDYLAIDLLGPSLDNLFRKSGKETMDLGSVCSIAIQVIERLEFMHNRGLLHRDIQLGNCVVGLPPNDKIIYMIDFGFSKRYIDPYTHRHIPDSKVKRDFIGNYWFTSVGVHCRGKVPSRRDDLEALSLMLIHLLTPRGLPWTRHGVPKSDDAHSILKRTKKSARPEDLCKGLPSEFEEFLRYCRSLKFMDQPDYGRWVEEFRELKRAECGAGIGFGEGEFVWPPPPRQIKLVGPRRSNAPPPPDDLRRILDDLKKLELKDTDGARRVLGDRSNDVRQPAQHSNAKDTSKGVIDLTGDSVATEDANGNAKEVPPPFMTLKAYKLSRLTSQLPSCGGNRDLAGKVMEFVGVMKGTNTSRTLTKDGMRFLDVLVGRLEGLGQEQQQRPTRSSSNSNSNNSADSTNSNSNKLGVVARLRSQVGTARDTRSLAGMVRDFGNVTARSTGRGVTKDGFAFLEGLAKRLEALG